MRRRKKQARAVNAEGRVPYATEGRDFEFGFDLCFCAWRVCELALHLIRAVRGE